MPQITLDYSANITNLDTTTILNQTHQLLASIADISSCKSRSIRQTDFLIGEGGANQAYIYLQVALLAQPDRTDKVKETLANNLISMLQKHAASIESKQDLHTQISVQITDLPQHYYKG